MEPVLEPDFRIVERDVRHGPPEATGVQDEDWHLDQHAATLRNVNRQLLLSVR
jgi:hypothetical protein